MTEEMPPQWMWHLDTCLDDWFTDVQAKRDERFQTGAKPEEADDSPGWVQNEYAKGRR